MAIKNRIKWKVVDSLLEQTESTPRELLDWLEWGFKHIDGVVNTFLCNNRLYLDKYYITNKCDLSMHIHPNGLILEDKSVIRVPDILTGESPTGNTFNPAVFWVSFQKDKDFRAEVITQYKKHYKLK